MQTFKLHGPGDEHYDRTHGDHPESVFADTVDVHHQEAPKDPFAPYQPKPIGSQPPPEHPPTEDSDHDFRIGANHQTQYVYYPPTDAQYEARHLGMNREAFRMLIMGMVAIFLVLFIAGIIYLGSKGSKNFIVQQQKIDDIEVFKPVPGERLAPAFSIGGEARGYWFRDGEFPILMYDKGNNLVGQGTAIAQGDITTTNFIPFQALIEHYNQKPTHKKGYLLFQGAGFEGPEPIRSFKLPIEFKRSSINGYTEQIIAIDPFMEERPQCSDGIDNDEDGYTDEVDPACHSDRNAGNSNSYDPVYPTETEGYDCYFYKEGGGICIDPPPIDLDLVTPCNDGVDNDGDGFADRDDPACHVDKFAGNENSYSPVFTTEAKEAGCYFYADGVNWCAGMDPLGSGGESTEIINQQGGGSDNTVRTHDGNINLFFPNDNDALTGYSCTSLYELPRSVGGGTLEAVARRTLDALLAGPSVTEQSRNYNTWIRRGVQVLDMYIDERDRLIITLSGDPSIPSRCGSTFAEAQIKRTLSQFYGIGLVIINY